MVGHTRDWAGKVVVITGASAGIGRATARRFARSGASLVLLARDAVSLEVTKAEMEAAGAPAMAIPIDVANAGALIAAAHEIESRLGPIAVWINNAMLTVFSPVHNMPPDEFRRVTEVTYLGFVHGTMAALRTMRPRNRGTIIQVGSALAYRGIPLQAAYCGAKHAIRGFTNALRAELIHDRIAIDLVIVEMPAVNTPQFDWARTHMGQNPRPVPPVIEPEVAADAIFKAAQAPRREIWLGLSTAKVILANMILPGFLDGYLARQAYDAQSTGEQAPKDRKDNLFAPVPELHRTRGSFSKEARLSAVAVSGKTARLGTAILAFALAVAAGFVLCRVLGIPT